MIRNDTFIRNEFNSFFSLDLINQKKNLKEFKYQSNIITTGAKPDCIFTKIQNITKTNYDSNKNYYMITTSRGNTIAISDDESYMLEIKESNQMTKESKYAPVSLIVDKINKNESVYVNIYSYGNEKEIKKIEIQKLKNISTYEDGVFLALLLHCDSDFYPSDPQKTQISIKYNCDEKYDSFNTWNKNNEISEKPDLYFTLLLNKILGYDLVANADTNTVDRLLMDGKEVRININTFQNLDNIFHSMVHKITKIYFNFDDYPPDVNIGFSDGTKNKRIPDELLNAILLMTSENFKLGFLSTLLDLHNFNTFTSDRTKNVLILKNELLVNILRETCSILSLKYQYERKENNLYYFKVIKDKLKVKETEKILSIEKIENPNMYDWFKIETENENIICNGFNLWIEK